MIGLADHLHSCCHYRMTSRNQQQLEMDKDILKRFGSNRFRYTQTDCQNLSGNPRAPPSGRLLLNVVDFHPTFCAPDFRFGVSLGLTENPVNEHRFSCRYIGPYRRLPFLTNFGSGLDTCTFYICACGFGLLSWFFTRLFLNKITSAWKRRERRLRSEGRRLLWLRRTGLVQLHWVKRRSILRRLRSHHSADRVYLTNEETNLRNEQVAIMEPSK